MEFTHAFDGRFKQLVCYFRSGRICNEPVHANLQKFQNGSCAGWIETMPK